jgi:hypothetical protein
LSKAVSNSCHKLGSSTPLYQAGFPFLMVLKMDQKRSRNNHIFRGLLQSNDGIISKVIEPGTEIMTFETTFGLNEPLVERLKHQPEWLPML